MPKYIVTFTSMMIEADDPDEAIDRAGDFKGGGNWEADLVDESGYPAFPNIASQQAEKSNGQ